MRKILAVLSTVALVAIAPPARAEQKEMLGRGNVALKLGFGVLTDDAFEDEDHTTFLELEGYARVAPNIYLGASAGTTFIGETDLNFFDMTDIDFFPFELNVKYAKELSPRFVVDVGGGVSYSSVSVHIDNWFSPDYDASDWLLGGQVFADLTCKFGWFSLGAYAKYQMTEEFKDLDADFNNWRGGLNVGVIF